MDNQNSDPVRTIIRELDLTGLHSLLDNFSDNPQEFNQEAHMLVLMGLDATVEGVGIWEEKEIAALNERAGANIGSERYSEEYGDVVNIAARQREFAYNLFFTGLADALACRFIKIAWQIERMIGYLPPEADADDPRRLIADLLKWSKHEVVGLDLKKVNSLDTSGGRLRAARAARNLLIHPKKPNDFSDDQNCARFCIPEIFNEDGSIQANRDWIRQIAEDAETLIRKVVDKHEHAWLMLLHDSLSRN